MVQGEFPAIRTYGKPFLVHSAEMRFLVQILTGRRVFDDYLPFFPAMPYVTAEPALETVFFPPHALSF